MVNSIKLAALAAAATIGLGAFGAAEAAAQTRDCAVDNIGVIDSRIHIRCDSIPGQGVTQAIYYFAMPLSEPAAKIDAVIALALEAKRTRRPLWLRYNINDYQSVPGCEGSNCRRLLGVSLR